MATQGDVLLKISSSCYLENVRRSIERARDNNIRTVALTGSDGGRCTKAAKINIHVGADNYGVIENIHQSLMHVFAQYLRHSRMDTLGDVHKS